MSAHCLIDGTWLALAGHTKWVCGKRKSQCLGRMQRVTGRGTSTTPGIVSGIMSGCRTLSSGRCEHTFSAGFVGGWAGSGVVRLRLVQRTAFAKCNFCCVEGIMRVVWHEWLNYLGASASCSCGPIKFIGHPGAPTTGPHLRPLSHVTYGCEHTVTVWNVGTLCRAVGCTVGCAVGRTVAPVRQP